MDFSPQHACMARFDEPTFCPNDISTLLSRYAVQLPQSLSSADQVPGLSEDDSDDSGGVPIVPHVSQHDEVELTPDHDQRHANANALHDEDELSTQGDQYLPSRPQSHSRFSGSRFASGRARGVEHNHSHHTTPSSWANQPHPTTVLGTRHPRPDSQELWDEEDSRRLRFALDGYDTADVPRFLNDGGADTPSDHDPSERTSTAGERPLQGQTAAPRPYPDSTPNAQQPPQPHATIRAAGREQDSAIIEADLMVIDDDRSCVDDPRRNYDFADFMDAWRLRSLGDKRFIPFEPGVQPSIRLWRPPDVLARSDMADGARDMQAIRWGLIGPSCKDAAKARVLLYPWRHQGSHGISLSLEDGMMSAESPYRFRNFVPSHRAKSPHYQLRNVVAANGRSDVFYANGSRVMKTSLACPTASETLMDLSKPADGAANVRITCLAASPPTASSSRFVLAGGFYGEYALLNLDGRNTAKPQEGFVTHAYNGLVTHVHTFTGRGSGTPQAVFCSNDRKLRLMDTSTLRFTNSFTYNHAINSSATSPDARLRLLVSDCHNAHITDAEKGTTLVTLQGHTDNGFACAWAPNTIHVATGSEDGRALVWDARNWSTPLRALPSTMSCPRSLHFTDNGALVVAEDDDIVSIYDADTFTKRQDLRFFGSIAGVALVNGGAELAVANADRSVGGLLTFQRAAQGLNRGTFGEKVFGGSCSAMPPEADCSHAIPNVFV